MFSKTYQGIVGIIAIETLRPAPWSAAARLEAEATLGQMLLHLATDSPPPGAPSSPALHSELCGGEARCRCMSVPSHRLTAPNRVAADFDSLAHELDRALVETRRRIAAAV